MSAPLPLFVYGTLRPGLRNHDRYLAGRCELIRPAVLPDTALHAGPGYPFALPSPGARVIGELLTIHPAAFPQVLAALDRLEDCRPDDTGLYVRRRLSVTVPGTPEPVVAWVYLAGPAAAAQLLAHPAPIPSGDWTDTRRGTS
ncbi:gamma-glutamylcyclotransferase family protein [Kitasatospora azatica]|uniref:gamma-glutamylcyclotransferase family protein n=1 Tax=Kitasatospora azatica TaxID=58347 RepID=UPI000563661A|nr:gamma-glutamylcyclotransferase family protein [Kitasatospora azatica]